MPSVLLLAVLSYILGFVCVAVLVGWLQSAQLQRSKEPRWPSISTLKFGLPRSRETRMDARLTGAGNIDVELRKVLENGLRDYVQSWYLRHLSADPGFTGHLRQTLQHVIVHISGRCKEVDVLSYCSQTLVEDCLRHLRLYKSALGSSDQEVQELVFLAEPTEDQWGSICTSLQATQVYLQGVTELILFLLLPQDEFQNAAVQLFTRDMLVWKVWIPLLQVLTQPDFINSLIVSLCRDPSLNAESFTAAINEGSSVSEREELQSRIYAELDRLKQVGVTASDQQKVAALESLQETLVNQEDSPSDDGEGRCPLSISTTIPEYNVVPDHNGRRHVIYHICVACRHSNAPIVEQWKTLRSYTDFHDLHITLRNLVGALPSDLSLPSQRSLHRLDPQFVDSRRAALQHYLDVAVSEDFLTAHPQALPQVVLFLSGNMYKHSSGELSRMVDSLVRPFRPSRRSSSKPQDMAKTSSSSPNPVKKLRVLPEAKAGSDEEEEGEFVHVLLVLFDEVFDVPGGGQWLRRQITTLVSQLIGDKINRKAIETIQWLTSPEQIAEYMRDLRNTVWPDGYRATPRLEPEEGATDCRALLARAKLIGSVPEDLRRLIGADTTAMGMARLSAMFQSEVLNRRLALVAMEGLLDALFPQRNLREAFRKLRTGHSKVQQ